MDYDHEFAFSNMDVQGGSIEAQAKTIQFAFSFPELVQRFQQVDVEAKQTKDSSRRIGYMAIGGVFFAMLIASSRTLWPLSPDQAEILGLVSAFLGITGTLLGLWNLAPFSHRRRWLLKRMQAESLRNFHFAHIAECAGEIITASGDAEKVAAYEMRRTNAYERLCERLFGQGNKPFIRLVKLNESVLEGIIEKGDFDLPEKSQAANDLFVTWRKMRLEWQLDYCNAKLSNGAPGGHATPRRTEVMFSLLAWVSVVAVLILHVFHFTSDFIHFPQNMSDFAIVAIALFALATRAVESGLATEGEVERYEQYRARLKVTVRRFDRAETIPAKIDILQSSEEVSLEEMIAFLKTQSRSQFLL